jgi:predicted deacylase
MTALAKLYSDYCTLTSIGTSVNGRQIYDLAVGDPNAEKSMLVVCTLHAREYICSAIAMEQIEYYLQHYNGRINGSKASDVFAKVQVHYIVMANPDGVMISQTKNSRWKANANGVDLNRNFPSTPFYVRGTKGAEGYSGKKALSEPESKAIATLTKKLIKNQNLLGVINYHAMGQIVFGNCTDKSLKKDTTTMYRLARKLTGYSSASSYSSATFGNYREYVMYQLGVPSITIEIGSTTAPCSFWEYASAYSKNKNVVFAITRALK